MGIYRCEFSQKTKTGLAITDEARFFYDKLLFYNSFRNLATEMFNCSRYFATVRRAML